MELGTRNIRSAGHGSGSIEVTLPSPLRDMAGLPCRIALRDGLRPEIVLVPEMRPAREAMQRLWNLLAPLLRQLLELHQELDHHPERLAALRRAWRQGVALELTGD